MPGAKPKRLPGNFTLALVATVIAASLLPCRGHTAVSVNLIANIAIGLLFFLHGAKLPRGAIVDGARHWRLHLVVLLRVLVQMEAVNGLESSDHTT
jgi:sodium/bile acid cotransporter 7